MRITSARYCEKTVWYRHIPVANQHNVALQGLDSETSRHLQEEYGAKLYTPHPPTPENTLLGVGGVYKRGRGGV